MPKEMYKKKLSYKEMAGMQGKAYAASAKKYYRDSSLSDSERKAYRKQMGMSRGMADQNITAAKLKSKGFSDKEIVEAQRDDNRNRYRPGLATKMKKRKRKPQTINEWGTKDMKPKYDSEGMEY